MKIPDFNSPGATGQFGFLISDLSYTFGLVASRASARQSGPNFFIIGEQPPFSGPVPGFPLDTGIAVPDSRFVRLEIRRDRGIISFVIDDVTAAYLPFPAFARSVILSLGNILAGMGGLIDYVKWWIPRLPVSSATLAQALGTHAESKTAVFDGTQDFVDIAWTNPFGDTSYRMPAPGVFVTAGTGVITANYRNKTATGIRVVPSARFTGEVYVDAHE